MLIIKMSLDIENVTLHEHRNSLFLDLSIYLDKKINFVQKNSKKLITRSNISNIPLLCNKL